MTLPPIDGGGGGVPPFRNVVLTAPVNTGVPPTIDDHAAVLPNGQPPKSAGNAFRDDPPISLAGRLHVGDVLPETTQLALALEAATHALQHGRADTVLTALDAVWSSELASDSPWYLRAAALQLLGRTADAEQVMRAAIAKLPQSAALLYLLAVHLTRRGLLEAAQLASDHALTLHPTEPLLWLQRAALTRNLGSMGDAHSMLETVAAESPAFPAAQWLDTLVRLGEPASPSATPVLLPLEAAVRYGLSLLESPTQSARTATHATHASVTNRMSGAHATVLAERAILTAARPEPPAWEALVLIGALIAIVAAPPLRLPALIVSGATVLLLAVRTRR
jgi:hypothetical protein